jgi:hypothetical protein
LRETVPFRKPKYRILIKIWSWFLKVLKFIFLIGIFNFVFAFIISLCMEIGKFYFKTIWGSGNHSTSGWALPLYIFVGLVGIAIWQKIKEMLHRGEKPEDPNWRERQLDIQVSDKREKDLRERQLDIQVSDKRENGIEGV